MSSAATAPWWSINEAPSVLGAGRGQALVAWLNERVAAPCPGLGRPGPLCPFVPQALRRGALHGVLHSGDPEVAGVRTHARRFAERWPASGREAGRQSLLVLFPDAYPGDVLHGVVIAIKPELLQSGLTCGEFHPHSDDRSARSRAVRIATSPLPLIAIRHLTAHDELFLEGHTEYGSLFEQWRGAR